MRIGYFADGAWSHKAIEKITSNKDLKISFIVPRYSTQDPVLKLWAKKLQIDYLIIKNVNNISSIEKLKKYNVDILVSMSFDQIFQKTILSIANLGTINCHAGALPFYRGRNILNWVLINDEPSFGVTVHYVNEGIDTGDIILQHKEKINDTDDYGSILNKATDICANLLNQSLINISKNKIFRIKQSSIDSVGSYYRKRITGDEVIDWNLNTRKIFNFVRSITTPGPCARGFIGENEVKIKKVAEVYSIKSLCKLGQIIKKNDNFYVKTIDGFLKIIEYETTKPFTLSQDIFFNLE